MQCECVQMCLGFSDLLGNVGAYVWSAMLSWEGIRNMKGVHMCVHS